LTPSHLSILPDYISTTSFNSSKCYYPQNNLKILIIDDCPSFSAACKFIIEKDFLDYFTSRPYLFVTIFKCEHSEISPNVCIELQKGFKSKRPLIISLEVENLSKVFYKNYGINERFIEVIYEYTGESQKVTGIKSLIVNLENGYYGSHSGIFEEITINKSKNDQKIEENSAEYLMNIFGERMDLLGIRFLHLFDSNLKPDISIILKILNLDFDETKLDGFCAVIDLGFEVTQNLKIQSSKGINSGKTIQKLAFSSTGHLKANSMDNRKCNSMDNFVDKCYFDDNFTRRVDHPVSISANELLSLSSFIRKSNLLIELNENIEHCNSGTSNTYATNNLDFNLSKEIAPTSSFCTINPKIPINKSNDDAFKQKDHKIIINVTKPDQDFHEDIADYVNLEDTLTVNNEESKHQTSKDAISTLILHPIDLSNAILNYNLDLKEVKEQNLDQKSQLNPNDQPNFEKINKITLDDSYLPEHSVIDSSNHLTVSNRLMVISSDNLDDFNLNPLINITPDPVIMKNLGSNLNFFLDLKFKNQENLLMLAIRCCNIQASQILINCGINVNATNQNHEIAADIASQKGQFEILLLLLHANSRFPHNFKIQSDAPVELRNFVKIMDILHEMICNVVEANEDNSDEDGEIFMKIEEQMQKIFSKIHKLIHKLHHLDYWFNTSNHSAVTTALLNKKFSTYNFLISKGLFMGIYEDIDSIKESLNEYEQELITEVNAYLAQPLPKDYILILKLNSFIWHSHKNEDSHLELITEALQILDENEYTQPLLEIVAAAKDFRIIFDFNRSSIEAIDFTVRSAVSAIFYAQRSHIYVGAKDMLDSDKKYHAIGTFAHELCHFAMQLTYNNNCRPYREGSRKESIFEKINDECVRLRCHERLVCMVYK